MGGVFTGTGHGFGGDGTVAFETPSVVTISSRLNVNTNLPFIKLLASSFRQRNGAFRPSGPSLRFFPRCVPRVGLGPMQRSLFGING
jgi:hypothetical protein